MELEGELKFRRSGKPQGTPEDVDGPLFRTEREGTLELRVEIEAP